MAHILRAWSCKLELFLLSSCRVKKPCCACRMLPIVTQETMLSGRIQKCTIYGLSIYCIPCELIKGFVFYECTFHFPRHYVFLSVTFSSRSVITGFYCISLYCTHLRNCFMVETYSSNLVCFLRNVAFHPKIDVAP